MFTLRRNVKMDNKNLIINLHLRVFVSDLDSLSFSLSLSRSLPVLIYIPRYPGGRRKFPGF